MLERRTHVVVDGDTLTGLAARYLGSSDRFREIFDANRNVLAKPDSAAHRGDADDTGQPAGRW